MSLFTAMHEMRARPVRMGRRARARAHAARAGASATLHESQSRLWENVVGRSLPFWRWFYPRLQETFPSRSATSRSRASTGGQPRAPVVHPRRRRRDELRPPHRPPLRARAGAHLGRLAVEDLPDAWNARFEELMGIPVPDDALGILQDAHWSSGDFGYFPTYLLGTVLSVQIWEKARADDPDVDEQIERGEFARAARMAPREHLLARPQAHAGRDGQARRRGADRPSAVPRLPRDKLEVRDRVAGSYATAASGRCSRASTRSSASTQRRVERDARTLAQERDRCSWRPRLTVDRRRDERVVDVADGEDPRIEVDLSARRPSRIPGSVEPLVVVAHQPAHGSPETPELVEQRARRVGCRSTRANSASVSGPGFLRNSSGTASLPTSWSRPPIASARRRAAGARAPRRPGPRAARPGACAPRCRRPSRPEPRSARGRASPGTPLRRDELGATKVARAAAASGDAAAQVERDREADDAIPTTSKPWPSHQPRFRKSSSRAPDERRSEPDEADGDQQVARRRVSRNVRSARQDEQRVRTRARRASTARPRAPRLRHGRDERRAGASAASPRPTIDDDARCEQPRAAAARPPAAEEQKARRGQGSPRRPEASRRR